MFETAPHSAPVPTLTNLMGSDPSATVSPVFRLFSAPDEVVPVSSLPPPLPPLTPPNWLEAVVYFEGGGRWRALAGAAVITLESKMAARGRINRSISPRVAVRREAPPPALPLAADFRLPLCN